MAWIDVYVVTDPAAYSPPREQPVLSMENLQQGAELWLDGCDGFFDQFFDFKRAGEELIFMPVPAGGLPRDRAAIESLLVVHSRLVEVPRYGVDAKTLIERIETLAQWARTAALTADDTMESVPRAFQPTAEIVEAARREGMWTSPPRDRWQPGLPAMRVVYCCTGAADGQERCVIICDAGSPWAHLVRV